MCFRFDLLLCQIISPEDPDWFSHWSTDPSWPYVQYQPTVKVTTKKMKDQVKITVEDNGSGIPQEIQDKIFQPFFTTKPSGKGTGLGLSLTYDIITQGHGGALELDSDVGKGTVFTIFLPVKD